MPVSMVSGRPSWGRSDMSLFTHFYMFTIFRRIDCVVVGVCICIHFNIIDCFSYVNNSKQWHENECKIMEMHQVKRIKYVEHKMWN